MRVYAIVIVKFEFIMADQEPISLASAEIKRDEKVLEYHRIDSLNILVYTILLSLTVVTVWVFKHHRVRFVHETGLAILYGVIMGIIIKYASPDSETTHIPVVPLNSSFSNMSDPPDVVWLRVPLKAAGKVVPHTFSYSFQGEVVSVGSDFSGGAHLIQRAMFDPEIFFNIILPPIIFNAGYSMKRKFFFKNLGAILTYAIVGTTISALVVATITYAFTRVMSSLGMTFVDCMFFGAIISATDPVTVLAVFQDLRVDSTLHALVFGESILNDAVALVLSSSVSYFAESVEQNPDFNTVAAIFNAIGVFFGVFFGSLAIGALMGCLTAMLTKFTKVSDYPMLETTLFVVMSYSSYNLAETLDLTGIVAVLFCGICQAHYTYNNLSPTSRVATKQFFELLNFVAENFIFTYIGVSMFTFQKHYWDLAFILVSFLAVIIARVCTVYPLSGLLNLGRHNKISLPFQHILFFAGLRGAIAFALAIRNTENVARRAIATTSSLIVIVTVIVCGGSTMQLLKWLKIPINIESDLVVTPDAASAHVAFDTLENIRRNAENVPVSSDSRSFQARDRRSFLARVWKNLDCTIMKPLLTHYRPSLMETCPNFCLPLAKIFTSSIQMSNANQFHDEEDDDDEEGKFPRIENSPGFTEAHRMETQYAGNRDSNSPAPISARDVQIEDARESDLGLGDDFVHGSSQRTK